MNIQIGKKAAEGITPAQFEEAMMRYYAAGLRGIEINKAIEAEINEVLEKHEHDLQAAMQSKDAAYQVVQAYCQTNKSRLFGKRRSVATQWGIAGFRLGTPRLKIAKGTNWTSVISKLKEALPNYIRTVEEPAKDLLLQHRNKQEVAGTLLDMGIEIVQDELFYIDAKQAA